MPSPPASGTQMHRLLFICLATLGCWTLPNLVYAQQLHWQESSTGCDSSLRGLSVVDDRTLWASGAKATVVRSVDAGTSWQSCGPQGFAQLEFRSIVAVDDQTATIASAGTPAVILHTLDGGRTWNESFRHPSSTAFIDGLRFWDRERGIAFSDPVDGRILIMTTADAGLTWQSVAPENIPLATENEGGFAASNSALCVGNGGRAWIGTGGTKSLTSRIYVTSDYGKSWSVRPCPLNSDATAGVFSIALHAELKLLVAVGGDYRPDATSTTTAAFSRDSGQDWQLAVQPPAAFVSAVSLASTDRRTKILIATGPTSSFMSTDGDNWKQFSSSGFHVLETSPSGRVFAVGSGGRFGKLNIQN